MKKICATCGKSFEVPDLKFWVYKLRKMTKPNKTFYFCKYTCKQEFIRQHEKDINEYK